ncbi:MAG: amino-acid N-acetyltransferase [Treponema sp.]|jgi:amino-acid N-acetyltransferase|nr:amino-acid N-acetyltransferase [Treponema sp.]
MDNASSAQVELIREVFHYQSRFEGSTMVFKIDYPVTEGAGFPSLVKDLALLAKTGFKVIIVPGAKEKIDEVLKSHGIVTSSVSMDGAPVRITTSQALPFVEMAAFDVAGRFMTFLSGSKAEAVIGNFVRARGMGVKSGVDTEHTGVVDKIYADSVSRVLNLGMIPILPCIGWSPSGRPYNVSSDEIALAASTALGAVKMFIISIYDGLRMDLFKLPEKIKVRSDGRLASLTIAEAEEFFAVNGDGAYGGISMESAKDDAALKQYLRELKLALRASKAGVHRAHIIDGREEGAILKELFSNMGVGTMIYADEYDSIRAFHSKDLPDVLRLMEPLMRRGILIRRNAEQIQEKKDDYAVFEIDGSIRACGALHDWGESQGEIAGVATDPLYADMGIGRRIVGFLIEKARDSRMRRVFALTTHTHDWFEALGFKEAPVASLPEQKRKTYDAKRNSKVFALEL